MQEATSEASAAEFAYSVIAGTGWEVDDVRKRISRLEPPDRYWFTYEVSVSKNDEQRKLRLVAMGAFDTEGWARLASRLEKHGAGGPCNPMEGQGAPRLFEREQVAYWFYPYDPTMPGLEAANDPEAMTRLLLGLSGLENLQGETLPKLEIERVRYLPEVGAIIRYTLQSAAGPLTLYGKVQPGNRGLRTHNVVTALWQAAARYEPGLIHLPQPLGYHEELGLLLEQAIPGKPVSGRRLGYAFQNTAYAAADALAVMHESGVETDVEVSLEHELDRLDRVAQQFIYVHPNAHFLLNDLITHMRRKVESTDSEERLPTHGDLKYDQFIQHNGRFTILDFDYFARAETSYDVGKYCGYVVPSNPQRWEETAVAEETRRIFLNRYREQRPYATLDRFQIYEALTLGLRAMSFMWAQMHGWERMAEVFLVMAYERLYTRLPA